MHSDIQYRKKPLLFLLEGEDGFNVHTFPHENVWTSLAEIFKTCNAKLSISFFPPELQLETFFYGACRMVQLPPSFGTVYNLAQTVRIMHLLRSDVLVTTPELAPLILKAISGNHLKHLIVVGTQEIKVVESLRSINPKVEVLFVESPYNNSV